MPENMSKRAKPASRALVAARGALVAAALLAGLVAALAPPSAAQQAPVYVTFTTESHSIFENNGSGSTREDGALTPVAVLCAESTLARLCTRITPEDAGVSINVRIVDDTTDAEDYYFKKEADGAFMFRAVGIRNGRLAPGEWDPESSSSIDLALNASDGVEGTERFVMEFDRGSMPATIDVGGVARPLLIGHISRVPVTLLDSESGYLSFGQSHYDVQEGANVHFEVQVTGANAVAADFFVKVTASGSGDGHASDPSDFQQQRRRGRVAPGVASVRGSFPVSVDDVVEGVETFKLELEVADSGRGVEVYESLRPAATVRIHDVVTVPADWELIPARLKGESDTRFRLVFLADARTAQSTDIDDYNGTVAASAGAGHAEIRDYKDFFRVAASTADVSAVDNTNMPIKPSVSNPSAPLYWLDGRPLAHFYSNFYAGVWYNRDGVLKDGTTRAGNWTAWTGMATSKNPDVAGQSNSRFGLGKGTPITWNRSGAREKPPAAQSHRLLAVSPIFYIAEEIPDVRVRFDRSSYEYAEDYTDSYTVDGKEYVDGKFKLVLDRGWPLRTPGTVFVVDTFFTATNSGVDYVSGPYEVVFYPGQQQATFKVPIVVDDIEENDESYGMTISTAGFPSWLSRGSPYSVRVTLADAGDGPVTEVWVERESNTVISEGDDAVFVVRRNRISSSPLTVNVTVGDTGDFLSSTDRARRTVTIPGYRSSAKMTLSTPDDSTDELDGTVFVSLLAGDGYDLGSPTSMSVGVNDDDPTKVTLQDAVSELQEAVSELQEGESATLRLDIGRDLRQGESLAVPLTFTGTATRGTTGDYTLSCSTVRGVTCTNLNTSPATVTFTGPSASEVSITLQTLQDDMTEGPRTVNVGLGAVTSRGLRGGTSTTDNFTDLTINDPPPPFAPDTERLAQIQTRRTHRAKIRDGINGTTGGYTSAQCRSTATTLGVTAQWAPWCTEIQRREDH